MRRNRRGSAFPDVRATDRRAGVDDERVHPFATVPRPVTAWIYRNKRFAGRFATRLTKSGSAGCAAHGLRPNANGRVAPMVMVAEWRKSHCELRGSNRLGPSEERAGRR